MIKDTDLKCKVHDNCRELFAELNELSWGKENIYRGMSSEEYIFPKLMNKHRESSELELETLERKYLSLFEKHSAQYLNHRNANEFITNAQHYGIYTRLVDFTHNPFIALFFA